MKNITFYILVSIITILLIVCIRIFVNYNVVLNEAGDFKKKLKSEISQIQAVESLERGKKIDIYSILKQSDSTRVKILDINNDIFCVRIPSEFCTSCLDSYLEDFSKVISKFGANRCVVAVNFEEDQIKYLIRRHPKIDRCIYNVSQFPLKLDNRKTPYILIINKRGYVQDILLTSKNFQERLDIFLDTLFANQSKMSK